jgi:hypothetical protein
MPKGIYQHRKGFHLTEEWKNKISASNMGKKCPWSSPPHYFGEEHPKWKGQDVSYSALHHWIKRKLGSPDICSQCGKSGLTGKYITWANISHKYLRHTSDWKRLCQSCHKKYDLGKIKL